ncbi:MAG: D-alanyl-D-alanine carboxypeptidase family protein [Clostridia bacterium]
MTLVILLIISGLNAQIASATPSPSIVPSAVPEVEGAPVISTKHILLYEANSKTVLYEKSGYDKAFPASTTKVMTCLIAVESGKLDDIVTIGNTVEKSGSRMMLSPREKISLRDLVYGMMLVSGNDAARAIAEYLAGSRDKFADIMNKKALELNMKSTHYMNPNGLDNEEHYTTAYDMAVLTAYALNNETFREIVSTKTHTVAPTNKNKNGYILENTNKLLNKKPGETGDFLYQYATGVKTGDTDRAGRCLVSSAKKDDMELVCILFGDTELNYRFTSAKKLFEWGFSNFEMLKVSDLSLQSTVEATVSNASVADVNCGSIELSADIKDSFICVSKAKVNDYRKNNLLFSIKTNFEKDALRAPVDNGEKVGTIDYVYNGEVIFTANLYATRDVAAGAGGTASSGYIVDDPPATEIVGNEWLFWLLAAVLVLILIIIIRLISRRKSQIRRRRRTSYTRGRR